MAYHLLLPRSFVVPPQDDNLLGVITFHLCNPKKKNIISLYQDPRLRSGRLRRASYG
jgi:hypothetical protein